MLKLRKNNEKGKLIVFEGTDGAGKTTLISMTKEYLSDIVGADHVLVTKQPTDLSRKTKLFQKMMYSAEKSDINYRAVQLLTLSDRIQHNTEFVLPALKQGKIVICDRYIYTSISNMLARGYRHEKWFFQACREIVKPDYAFLAYVEPETAIARIKSRPEERDRYLDEELLRKVSSNFVKYGKRWGLERILTDRPVAEAFEEIKRKLTFTGEKRDAGSGFEVYNGRFAGQTE